MMQNSEERTNCGSCGPFKNIDVAKINSRVRQVVLNPVSAWKEIREESISIKQIYVDYILLLAAIPAVCWFIGFTLFGQEHFFSGVLKSLYLYCISLTHVILGGIIISKLAPFFGGSTSLENACKLTAFSSIPFFVVGVFYLIPSPFLASTCSLLGLYSFYVFYVGIPEMTGVPYQKQLPFFISYIVALIIFGVTIQAIF